MQTLDVISVNLWQVLISLCNLVIIFLIVKRFLYRPVKKMLASRQQELDAQYDAAKKERQDAAADRAHWQEKLQTAQTQAQELLQRASTMADRRGEDIVNDAKVKARDIIQQAETEAELQRRKVRAQIRHDVIEVSAAMTEKMLQRELTQTDQAALIDSFIAELEQEQTDDEHGSDR